MSNRLFFYFFLALSFSLTAQQKKEFIPIDLPREIQEIPKVSEASRSESADWSLVFDHPFGDPSFYGGYYGATYVEPTNTFWVSVGHTDEIYELAEDGTILDTFSVDGVHYITSMTTDGEHVYAVTYNQYILEIDPLSRTLVNTIVPEILITSVAVTYDADADNGNGGFWLNYWHQNLTLINRQGEIIDNIPFANLAPYGIYGIAYDNLSAGGPYIWVMDIGNSYNTPQTVRQVDIETKTYTGVYYTITNDIAINEYYIIGEDLFVTDKLFDGTIILGGTVTGFPYNHLFGYDIGSSAPQLGPGNATFPQPSSYQDSVTIDSYPTISWTNPSGAGYNKVYFGTDLYNVANYNPAALVLDGSGSVLYNQYDAGVLDYSTTYYWRVVEYAGDDSSRGRVWRFSTRQEPSPKQATNILAVWNEAQDVVSVSWTNPETSIYDDPLQVDSAYILADGNLVGKVIGNSESYNWTNPESGIFEISIVVFDNNFASQPAYGPMVGVDIYYNTYSLNNLNAIIPDDHGYTPLISTLTLAASPAVVEKVILSVDTIYHSWVGDLDITLRSPSGTEVLLSADNGGAGNNIFNAVFDDDAELPIHGAAAPFTGQWYPQESLSAFNNEPASGEWHLIILDDFPVDQGSLEAWTLTLITNIPMPGNENLLWELPIEVSNSTDGFKTLHLGESVAATDSIDTYLGERILPPLPPFELFDTRMELPTNPVEYSWKDYRPESTPDNLWVIKLQSPAESYPVILSWDPELIPETVELHLMDGYTGNIFKIEMRETNSITIDNPAVNVLHIQKSSITTMSMPVFGGWNLISMPMMLDNMEPLSVFQNATSEMFGFNGGYFAADELTVGNGYWVQFEVNHTVGMSGNLLGENYIAVNEGWNLVGVHHYNVDVSSITSEPSGIIATQFFGFDEGYSTADILFAGKGYWVKSNSDGILHLPPSSAAKRKSIEENLPDARLIVTDKAGRTFTLYLNDGTYSGNKFLPPPPPLGAPDVRFTDDTFVSDLSGNSMSLSGLQYPVEIGVAGIDINIRDAATGSIVNSGLRDGEKITLSDVNINRLSISSVEIPANYSLEQNYPNPFNPATTIKFSLPENENVTIQIYNALGELVKEIVNGQFDAGYHTVNFNASNLSSGVYIYRIQAGSFTNVKKMMLLK